MDRVARALERSLMGALLLLVTLAAPASGAVPASTPLHDADVPAGEIDFSAPAPQGVYIAGGFRGVGPQTYGAPVDAATGRIVRPLLADVDGSVNVAAPDGAGGYYVVGGFDRVGTAARNGFARILADGSVDATFVPPEGPPNVTTVMRSGSVVYVGGQFTEVDGEPRANLAAFDAGTGELLDWNPGMTGAIVYDLDVEGGTVYVGGQFSHTGGADRDNIAAISTT
ncbi:MAG TPA: hypothetical protein VF044_03230, partial [Actinomycetota bacterium]